MPAPKELQYRRTHNLLLINKLLGGRENASPFTLVLDSLEQRGRGLVGEMGRRAAAARTNVIYVSYETLRKPANVSTFIHAFDLSPSDLQKRLAKYTTNTQSRTLIIIDTLHPLLSSPTTHIPTFLSSLMLPSTSLTAIYHTDIPPPSHPAYLPPPLTLLRYLATTLLTTHSLSHILAQKSARDRSRPEPLFGLAEDTEGVVQGLGSNDARGTVVEMEYRRKSGRGVSEWFFLAAAAAGQKAGGAVLLEDHALYARAVEEVREEQDGVDSTFDLGLTEKQRRDREGVVLPYFDAQRDGGGGEGGRILYEMSVEDDFDEEEDEI